MMDDGWADRRAEPSTINTRPAGAHPFLLSFWPRVWGNRPPWRHRPCPLPCETGWFPTGDPRVHVKAVDPCIRCDRKEYTKSSNWVSCSSASFSRRTLLHPSRVPSATSEPVERATTPEPDCYLDCSSTRHPRGLCHNHYTTAHGFSAAPTPRTHDFAQLTPRHTLEASGGCRRSPTHLHPSYPFHPLPSTLYPNQSRR